VEIIGVTSGVIGGCGGGRKILMGICRGEVSRVPCKLLNVDESRSSSDS